MTPFRKLSVGLAAVQTEFNEMMTELRSFAEVMANKTNSLELDDKGFYYTTAAGPIEEIIPVVRKQLDKLERIKKQKDNTQ